MKNQSIDDRMKDNYEKRSRQYLTRRVPTIIRLDGKAFHTYTKGLDKPFDEGLMEDMKLTAIHLCENIQGAVLSYVQSDEITIVLQDYKKLTTDAWFDYNVQKMTSISASMATAKFNQLRTRRHLLSVQSKFYEELDTDVEIINIAGKRKNKSRALQLMQREFNVPKLAYFDSRVFQIPEKEEVVNCLIWRQQDATRNSIQMLGQSLYSQKELHEKNTSEIQEMTFQKGHNWNDLHYTKKRGTFIKKITYVNGVIENTFYYKKPVYGDKIRTKWVEIETPIFSQDRDSILNLL